MAERETAITPTRGERRLARGTPLGWRGYPFRPLQRFADELERVFDEFGLGRRWSTSPAWRGTSAEIWEPDVEVFQKDNELIIRADLPGLKKDEISVDVTDGTVTIQGERRREREEEREGVYRSERTYGSFCRVVPLPEGAIVEEARANFRDGVLEITMPTPPTPKARRLEITEGAKK